MILITKTPDQTQQKGQILSTCGVCVCVCKSSKVCNQMCVLKCVYGVRRGGERLFLKTLQM